jgi:glycosyltransferase involved in cell wall biosynthesis
VPVKENLLFVSAHLPSADVPQAGQKIARETLCEYTKTYNVHLVSFYNEVESDHADPASFPGCAGAWLFPVSRLTRLRSFVSNIRLPLRGAVRANVAAVARIRQLLAERTFSVVHLEYTAALYYLHLVPPGVRTVVTEHDITYQGLERRWRQAGGVAKLLYRAEYLRQRRWELDLLARVDEIRVLSGKDRQLLIADGIPGRKICIVSPRVNPGFARVTRTKYEPGSILFWGAMNRQENVDAVAWFIDDIFPLVVREVADARLYIVGANPPAEVLRYHGANIAVTGFVEDPLPWFERCRVAIAPLRLGAGIKIKVLEYLKAGMPVVATSVGAEGISGENLMVADLAEDFARAIVAELKRPYPEGDPGGER